jgi:hypothetical protein
MGADRGTDHPARSARGPEPVRPGPSGWRRYLEAGSVLVQVTRAHAGEVAHSLQQAGEDGRGRVHEWIEGLVDGARRAVGRVGVRLGNRLDPHRPGIEPPEGGRAPAPTEGGPPPATPEGEAPPAPPDGGA